MTPGLRALMVQTEPRCELLVDALRRTGYEDLQYAVVSRPEEMRAALVGHQWDLVLCDSALPDLSADVALELLNACGLDLPFILVSDSLQEEAALELIRAGAHDIVRLGHLERLGEAVQQQLREAERRAEKRHWEQAVRLSEERYRNLFERNLAGVYRATENGRLLECNESFARMFGYASAKEAVANLGIDIHADPAERAAFVDELRRRGEVRNSEKQYKRRSGEPVWVIEHAHTVADGDPGRMLIEGTVIDVTERRRAQEQLLQAQKMEAVGRLAGGVAHDFNNLLQAMLGVVQLEILKLRQAGREDETLAELKGLVDRGAQLARQLLLFSRREKPRVAPLDLNDVVTGTQKLLKRLLRENIDLRIQPVDDSLPVIGDRGQLEQVLVNLAVNAADAMPEGGRLGVRTGRGEGDEAWLEVTDSGQGIPEDVRDRIFEPFFTTKGRHTGTGLGLSVVHGIVTEHSGRIELDSTVGRGTTFRVVLPLTTSAGPDAAATASRHGIARGPGRARAAGRGRAPDSALADIQSRGARL